METNETEDSDLRSVWDWQGFAIGKLFTELYDLRRHTYLAGFLFIQAVIVKLRGGIILWLGFIAHNELLYIYTYTFIGEREGVKLTASDSSIKAHPKTLFCHARSLHPFDTSSA